jgi:hypothetical protein
VVILQNCIDLRNSECGCHSGMCATSSEDGTEVIRVQLDGVTEVTEGEDCEAMTSSSIRIDHGVGFMSIECLACFISIQKCLTLYQPVFVKQLFDSGEWFCQVVMVR